MTRLTLRIVSRSVVSLLLLPLCAQSTRDDLTPLEIAYTFRVAPDFETVHIGIDVGNLRSPHTRLAMPNWMPGTYFIGRFGEQVQEFTATAHVNATEKALAVTRADFQTWSVDTDGITAMHVEYALPRRMARFGRQTIDRGPVTGFQIAGPTTFLYVVGHKERPVTVRYELPDGWQYRNGLLATEDPMTRRARDYDTFADAPTLLGKFQERTFTVGGTRFECVYFSNNQIYDFDLDAATDVCRRIVTYQGRLFGSFPFERYVFLFSLPGGGGLEHLNSTSIGLNPAAMNRDPSAGASVTAHEFFHAWNVKRIRPAVLGPFEYEHEDYTENLYVSEGWTSYYGDLTLVRTGLIEQTAFLQLFERYIASELNKEGRKLHSVSWASRNVWHRDADEPERVDYYDKGELLGALIDLQIRHHTENRKSLDDVMRFLNRWFAERDVGFAERDIERACTAISNHDFGEFFVRHVYGTLDPPLAEVFAYAGIDYREETVAEAAFPFSLQRSREGLRVGPTEGAVAEASAGGSDLPAAGAIVTAIAGEAVRRPEALLRDRRPGDVVKVSWTKDGSTHESDVTLMSRPTMVPHLQFATDPTPEQLAIRAGWLTGEPR